MSLMKGNGAPRRYTHLYRPLPRRNTKTRVRVEKDVEDRRAFNDWYGSRTSDAPLTRERYVRSLRDGRVKRDVGGVWISKRALHEDCVATTGAAITWAKFLIYWREVHRSVKKRSFDFTERLASGTLISRYSEVFEWFPASLPPSSTE